MKSGFLTLKTRDFLRGLIMGVGTPILYLLQEMIPNWPLGPLEKTALSSLVTYLIKNLFTNDTKAATDTIQRAGGVVLDKKSYSLPNKN